MVERIKPKRKKEAGTEREREKEREMARNAHMKCNPSILATVALHNITSRVDISSGMDKRLGKYFEICAEGIAKTECGNTSIVVKRCHT